MPPESAASPVSRGEVEPERVMSCRGGSVLGKKTILKSDHFPGCQNRRLSPQIEGAPNYRQAGSLCVHGVAIPTTRGIRNVLDHIGKHKRVLWHSLREEPVVYVNGRPFVLRDVERPFSNLEYTGINRSRVEEMEARLKEDILTEASQYGNKILVTDELPDGQMLDQWEPVMPNSVKTPLEVYEELQGEGYLIDYERVPITDEKAPKEQDFDTLVQRIAQVDVNTEMIFNCQMGRGRTTTGMVIATLVYLNRIGSSGISRTSSIGKIFNRVSSTGDDVPDSEEAIRRGEYSVIRSLIRVLEGGVEGKMQVDRVIDKCATMQNLREAIAGYRSSVIRQADEMKKAASLSFFVEYLERYYFLICFAVYIHTEREALRHASLEQISFSDWMHARPELYSILRRLLRRNPMGALGYSSPKPSLMKIAESAEDGRPFDMSAVAARRRGEVLGRQTVLKSDHCPGCQNHSLPEKVEGAPNFRKVAGFPVYGVANPTVDGIRAVIRRIGDGGMKSILWHNMREEPVVYINGKPFVLREVERPYKNMLEYTGIDRERVERMEARLKEDILREAERYGGAIMVIDETDEGQIFDAWERVGAGSVQTPLEVFRLLEAEGLPIKYARVPITDGKAPRSSDFDTIALNAVSAPKDAAFVFNCQMGRGRTTTGTVIACLLLLRICHGRPMAIPPEAEKSEEKVLPDSACSSSSEDAAEEDGERRTSFVIDDIHFVKKMTRLFDNGVECREVLDAVIDRCSALQNIRQAVLHYRRMFNQQHAEPRVRRVALYRGSEYLERYFRLIAFAAYLGSEAFDGFCGQGEGKISFRTWLHRQQEVQAVKWSIRLRPGRFFSLPRFQEPVEQQGDVVMEAIVKARNGYVLAKGSILKSCSFSAGEEASRIYKASGFPVYSAAVPTESGVREIVESLGQKVMVTDVRAEAGVFVNGVPFVLRELDHPEDSLKHVGITGPLLEHMERRLVEDVKAELAQRGGLLLLHRDETDAVSNRCSVVGYREKVSPDQVKTVSEVFAGLREQGYHVDYLRLPLTRDRDPVASDVDAIQYRRTRSSGEKYLFISRRGRGVAAYAMAITCLGLGGGEVLLPPEEVTGEEALRHGDYRDVLSLTRVLTQGPKSKAEVDWVVERCAGAGHLRDDIFRLKKELESCDGGDEELRTHVQDRGIKALRRYLFLITYRAYLYSAGPEETSFSDWMAARPELGHLCDNLRLD